MELSVRQLRVDVNSRKRRPSGVTEIALLLESEIAGSRRLGRGLHKSPFCAVGTNSSLLEGHYIVISVKVLSHDRQEDSLCV